MSPIIQSYGFFSGIKSIIKIIVIIIIIIFLLPLFFGFFGTVGAGERGVLLRFGAVQNVVFNEGLYFKFPYID
ncbi:hypothetical protein KAZ01_02800, partial [Candidatus Gracilibacteria bacterium]|nr:hypothetical protein [Candidatus Gracilibacteria bacterium]